MSIIKDYIKKTENLKNIPLNFSSKNYIYMSHHNYFKEIVEITTKEETNIFNFLKNSYGNIGYKLKINQPVKYINSFKKALASAGKIYPNNIYIITDRNEILYYDHQNNKLLSHNKNSKLTQNYTLIITGDIHKGYSKYNLYNYKLVTLDSGLLLGSIIDHLNYSKSVILNLNFNYEKINKLIPSKNEIIYFSLEVNNDDLKTKRELFKPHKYYYIKSFNPEINYMMNIHYQTFNNNKFSYDITNFCNIKTLMTETTLLKRKSVINYRNSGFYNYINKINNLLHNISKIFTNNSLFNNIKLIIVIYDEKISLKDIDNNYENIVIYTKENSEKFNKMYRDRNLDNVDFLEFFITYNNEKEKNYRREMIFSSCLLYYITFFTTLEDFCGCPVSNYNIAMISEYLDEKYHSAIAISYLVTPPEDTYSSRNFSENFYRI